MIHSNKLKEKNRKYLNPIQMKVRENNFVKNL